MTVNKWAMVTGFCLFFLLSGCATKGMKAQDPAAMLKETWGVEVMGARLTAADYMIDFRYKVLDPVKAAPLFVVQTKPKAIVEKTGESLAVPSSAKVGSLRQRASTIKEGKIFFIFFGNPGHAVERGDRISVVIGDFRADNVLIQ